VGEKTKEGAVIGRSEGFRVLLDEEEEYEHTSTSAFLGLTENGFCVMYANDSTVVSGWGSLLLQAWNGVYTGHGRESHERMMGSRGKMGFQDEAVITLLNDCSDGEEMCILVLALFLLMIRLLDNLAFFQCAPTFTPGTVSGATF
jgi:hypothetical protein